MSRDLLTLCVVARSEEAQIEGCLASAREIVDDMVVVDTGSADATPIIAHRMGARVEPRAWSDDFSAARNFGISKVTTPWILMMDADERISECNPQALRTQLTGAAADCNAFSVRIDNELDGGGISPFRAVRLFRNRPEIRYRGIIHEEISSSLAELAGDPVELEPAQLVLRHSGYTWEARQQRSHKQRNLRLLRQALKSDPRQALLRLMLARELQFVSGERVFPGEDFDEALTTLEQAWQAAREEGLPIHLSAAIASALATALTAAARPREALERLREAPKPADDTAEWILLEFARARALLVAAGEDRELLGRAERMFARLIGRNPQIGFVDLDVRLPGVFAVERRAEALGRLGHKDDALALLDQAAELEPAYAGTLVRRAQLHLLNGEVQPGLDTYVQALRRDGHDPEAWIGTARVLNALGQYEQAIECVDNALKLVPLWGEALLELALYRLLANQALRWLEDYSSLRDACPEVDVACLVAEILAGSRPSPLRGWPQQRVERAMVTLTRGLALAKRQDLLDRLKPKQQHGSSPSPVSGAANRESAPVVARPTDFVLLSHPRSGTNNLLGILNRHPDIVCAGELFNPQDDGPNYARKLGCDELVENKDVARLTDFFARAREHEGKPIVGFKLFCYQLDGEALEQLVRDPRVPKLLLERRNLLQAYISWDVARRTQQWRLRNGERALPEPFEVDLEQARKWLERNRNELEHYRQIMQEHGVPFFDCNYETLFTAETLNRIYSFLGAREQEAFEHKYRVQRSAEVYERILNREQLEDAFGEDYGLLVPPEIASSARPHV